MVAWKSFGAVMLVVSVLSAQQAIEDPVLKVRSQRAGSSEGDLPPVPRGILEPPPLPPPEKHVKDTRGYRAPRRVRKSTRRTVKSTKKAPVPLPIKKKLPKKKP